MTSGTGPKREEREELADAPEAGDHLVGDQRDAVLVGERARRPGQ
jgi:hypothetical protein